jgi:xanthine dehydrogenase accessory factor
MDRVLLDALNAARAEKRRVVLATALPGGTQALLVDGVRTQGTLEIDAALLSAAEDALVSDKARALATAEGEVFLRPFNPPLRLMIVGAVHIAQSLAPMAALCGYAVTVTDPRRAWATEARFPAVDLVRGWPEDLLKRDPPDRRTAVVVLTHDPKIDDPALVEALRSEAFYVAALGSRKTHAGRVERLLPLLGEEPLARLAAPAGLDIGAISPAEIAVSVLAQMTLALRGSKGGAGSIANNGIVS